MYSINIEIKTNKENAIDFTEVLKANFQQIEEITE